MNGRKLNESERNAILAKPMSERAQRSAEYDALLADFDAGDVGLLTLDGENRVTVRQRLLRAAERQGMALRFIRRRGRKTELYFTVIEA